MIVWVILGLPGQNLGWPRSWGCSCEPGDDPPPGLCFLEASLLRYGDYGWQNTLVFELGFPGSSADKESACDAGDPGSIPESGRSPGEGIGYPLQYSWASLVAQMVKNRSAVWKTRVRLLGWEDPLEEGMAHCSRVLAWRIPMDREEPGGLQSIGSQRVGHHWATKRGTAQFSS